MHRRLTGAEHSEYKNINIPYASQTILKIIC